MLTQALGRDQEIQKEAQSIPLEVRVQETEHLTQDSGCCGLERRIEARQGMLDSCVEGWRVLWGTGGRVIIAMIIRTEATSRDLPGPICLRPLLTL